MTDRLRTLWTQADQALTIVGTTAVELDPDDPAIRRLWADAEELMTSLVVRGLEDLAARAFPGTSASGGPVSSSAVSDPTGTAGTTGRLSSARDYHTVARTLQHACGILADAPTHIPADALERASTRQAVARTLRTVVDTLTRCRDRLTPVATGEPCPSVATDDDGTVVARCEGSVTHHSTGRGLCAECDADWRPRRGLEVPADVLSARNARRKHPCTCHSSRCDHDPGGCLGMLAPGDLSGRCERCACTCDVDCCPEGCSDERAPGRTVSERCHKRQVRATYADAS